MAETRPEWHGHRLSVLPQGESWLSGGQRRPAPVEQPPNPWPFDEWDALDRLESRPDAAASGAGDPASEEAASRRGTALLALLGLAALITIIAGRHSGGAAEVDPMPEPPSQTITALSRAHPTVVKLHVGDYLKFQLPEGHTYTAVTEQADARSPVLEALPLPGQQPQLRSDNTGHAVVEVMQEPVCSTADGCPDQRVLLGGIDITVSP